MTYSDEYLAGVEETCRQIAKAKCVNVEMVERDLKDDIRDGLEEMRNRLAREKAIADAMSLLESEGYFVTPLPGMPVDC